QSQQRDTILAETDTALTDYESLIQPNSLILALPCGWRRYIRSLQKWVDGNRCIAREETEYLQHCDNLVTAASSSKGTVLAWIKIRLEPL
ncbi:hypothetical protein DM02DRAFT_539782, partial [Periconia macrospinosa]